MSGERLRCGLIGLGTIHYPHLRGYAASRERAAIVAVCDVNVERAQARAQDLGATPYGDYRRLLEHPGLDVVDVMLPHHLHAEVALAALERGKHVLVEKPMATSSETCARLIAAARARGVRFTVAENTRFVRAYLAVERLLRAGELGEVRLVRTLISGSEVVRLRNPSLWKGRRDGSCGGVIMDAAPHSIYLLKWLFGEVADVRAFHTRLVAESEVEDHAVVAGHLRGGAPFTTEYTFTAELPWSERLEVYGSRGAVIVDQLAQPPVRHFRGPTDYEGAAIAGVARSPMGWKVESVGAGVADFLAAVADGREPGVDPQDGAYAVAVVEAAYESARRGGASVSL